MGVDVDEGNEDLEAVVNENDDGFNSTALQLSTLQLGPEMLSHERWR